MFVVVTNRTAKTSGGYLPSFILVMLEISRELYGLSYIIKSDNFGA
jgi:hypothetical protein